MVTQRQLLSFAACLAVGVGPSQAAAISANPGDGQPQVAEAAVAQAAILGPFGIFVPGPDPVPAFTGTTINFEGFPESTPIDVQFSGLGVTFTQDDGGTPMIDNAPFLFGYESGSGESVLTGSTSGGAPFPTVAGLVAAFDPPALRVGAFMTDMGPIGNYTVTIFDTGGFVIDSLTVLASDFPALPGFPNPDPSCSFPSTGTGCGVWVGFDVGSATIGSIQFGPSIAFGDAFAIDDLAGCGRTPRGRREPGFREDSPRG